jgi:restriction endonuclease Mrr
VEPEQAGRRRGSARAVRGAAHRETGAVQHMRVDHRRVHIRVAQQFLHGADVGPVLQEVGGERMAQLMIDHNVGVSTVGTYEIKKVDSDYFSEE